MRSKRHLEGSIQYPWLDGLKLDGFETEGH